MAVAGFRASRWVWGLEELGFKGLGFTVQVLLRVLGMCKGERLVSTLGQAHGDMEGEAEIKQPQ